MAAPGNVAARRDTRVLLPFTCDSLRIPDELAEEIGATDAYVAVPICKGKVQRVEIGKDGDGAFLGRGWPEIAAKFGIGAGWFLVLRHHGRGMLTLKAFDDSGCLRELPASTPAAAVEATTCSRDTTYRPQFLSLLPQDSMGKMQIPAKIVQSYIPKEHLNNHTAVVFGPHTKNGHIEVEMNPSNIFFAVSDKGQEKEEISKPAGGTNDLPKASLPRNLNYSTEPPSLWIKKQMTTKKFKIKLYLAKVFCDAIGLRESRKITLKISSDSDSSWRVHGYPSNSYILAGAGEDFAKRTDSMKATFVPSML
ncbi:hypothetical protein QOZ80_4BG0358100 [Eleusine coracana subsp. coracana]|nr:hypothetical protein QOZ80_4BG0358100 [Eleusine coracana subsp. coracana]